MTRVFVIGLIALAIYTTVQCKAESLGDPEVVSNQKDDNEVPSSDDIDRSGSAQAYASVTRLRPMQNAGIPLRFVNCYACVDCPKIIANSTMRYCPYSHDPTKNGKCVVYAEKYMQTKKQWWARGCASELGSCTDLKRGHDNSQSVKLISCTECDGDKCNTSGAHPTYNFTAALFVLIICPVFGKFLLI